MISFSIIWQLIPGIALIFVTGVYIGMRLNSAIEKRNKKEEQ